MNTIDVGLEGVVVGETAISHVDGERGRLSYRGVDIAELVNKPFLQVAWLLLFGDYPDLRQEQRPAHFLLAHRKLAAHERDLLAALPASTHPIRMLQALVPVLDLEVRSELELTTDDTDVREGLIIAARIPSLVAAWWRRRQGLDWPVNSNRLDPRATLLKPMARTLCAADKEAARLLATLEAIEAAAARQLSKPGRELHANVEFYKGAVFHALGLPGDFFTAMFAMARVYGYLAHALEFKPSARLIRPRARYIGAPARARDVAGGGGGRAA